MKCNYYDGKYKVGEKTLYLIHELNKNKVSKEKIILILRLWAKDALKNIKKEHKQGRITDLQFIEAKRDIEMVILEALYFIDNIMI